MADIQRLKHSLTNFDSFPRNLVYHTYYDHVLEAHADRLSEQNARLFNTDGRSDINLWECRDQSSGKLI